MHCQNIQPIPILTYHQIAPAPAKPAPFRSLYVTPASFDWQMRLLQWTGFTGLSMEELMPYLRGEKVGKVVGITLDDGYENNFTTALPILQKYGFTATCYFVSALAGQSNKWDHNTGILPAPLMNASQIRGWSRAGMEVGAHTQNHVNLNAIDLALAWQEIRESKTELELLVGKPVSQFCYPFGYYRAEHAQRAAQAGFVAATTTNRGKVSGGDDMHQLRRIPIVRSTYTPKFLMKLLTSYESKYKRAV